MAIWEDRRNTSVSRKQAPEVAYTTSTKRKDTKASRGVSVLFQSHSLNISIHSPEHCDADWMAIPDNIKNNVILQDSFELPRLESLCEELLADILEKRLAGFDPEYYIRQVDLHGGTRKVTSELVSHVDREILPLQQNKITRKLLDQVRGRQNSPWAGGSGYTNYVTDDRNDEYFRQYVGQSFQASVRIRGDHRRDIQEGHHTSLHHFILWIGNGHRTANFIRLWTLPQSGSEKENKQWADTKMNLLEALFFKAFRTHHGFLNRPHGDESLFGQFKSFGLNVMTPLKQNQSCHRTIRIAFTSLPQISPDEQISYWSLIFRGNQAKMEAIQSEQQVRLRNEQAVVDIWSTLQAALRNESLFLSVKESISADAKDVGPYPDLADYPSFLGSFSAKIGFVVDRNPFEKASSMDTPQTEDRFPWALGQCGFNTDNALLWMVESDQSQALKSNDFVTTRDQSTHQQKLLNCSNARVILLHGRRAEKAMDLPSMMGFALTVHGSQHDIYIARSNGTISHRLIICCPRLPNEAWQPRDATKSQLSEIFRWATFAVSLSGVYCYALETTCILRRIFQWRRLEKNGIIFNQPLDEDTKLWLARKGISKEAFSKIHTLAGSVPRALVAILISLSTRSDRRLGPRPKQSASPSKTHPDTSSIPFGPELRSVQKMIGEISKQRTEQVARELDERGFTKFGPPDEDQADSIRELSGLLKQENAATEQTPLKPEVIAEVKSILIEAPLMEHKARDIETDLDLDITSVNQICKEAILSFSTAPLRKSNKHIYSWRQEKDRFRDKEYPYHLNLNPRLDYIKFKVHFCNVFFSKLEDLGDGIVNVKIEIEMDKQEHPQYYATGALASDPARRLALKLRWHTSSGREVQRYYRYPDLKAPHRANTLFDMLVHGKSFEEIAQLPRRYIDYSGNPPPGFERFKNGGYTSELLVID
ncbi:hypothetical protein N7474_000381 [Penicillium riverlandense]|uniref:uncharacterized protein n=1 Tax=Penicillium riverlandense TaxID=1903569 RepID=UPI002546B302|nr:uncharacterized protein N7474_000381 [Penicillium riverlandense]KAJ5832070.1 hypothetical protein N7474_000381 [Penicillium riverlandense]